MSCIVTTTALRTINLPVGVLVACTRTDKIKVLAHKNAKGKVIKEQIIPASFREMLKKGVLTVCTEIPKNLKPMYEGMEVGA
jgi:hypothetical protein